MLSLLPAQPRYIASVVSRDTGLGYEDCPWLIRVRRYQRVRITLIDFAAPGARRRWGDQKLQGRAARCLQYAVVADGRDGDNRTICGGRRRRQLVFTSETNVVQVQLTETTNKYFLLHYEGVCRCVGLCVCVCVCVCVCGMLVLQYLRYCNNSGSLTPLPCKVVNHCLVVQVLVRTEG